MEIKEIKGAGPQKAENSPQNRNQDKKKGGEEQEREKKTEELKDNQVKRAEKENREQDNSFSELAKQMNELKIEMNTKHEEATTMSGQNSKKIMDIKHENDNLKNNVHQLQAEKRARV